MRVSHELDVVAACIVCQPSPQLLRLLALLRRDVHDIDPTQFHQAANSGAEHLLIVEVLTALVVTDAPFLAVVRHGRGAEISLVAGKCR